jgi:hypothetical protein
MDMAELQKLMAGAIRSKHKVQNTKNTKKKKKKKSSRPLHHYFGKKPPTGDPTF